MVVVLQLKSSFTLLNFIFFRRQLRDNDQSEINTNAALQDDKWRSVIDGGRSFDNSIPHQSNDRFLKHRETYGSPKWIAWRLVVVALIAFAGMETITYIGVFHGVSRPYWSSSVLLAITYWFSTLLYWIYDYFMPLIIFYIILRYISVLDDAIGLQKEVRIIAIMYFAIAIISIIVLVLHQLTPILGIIYPQLIDDSAIIFTVSIMVRRICYTPINYTQTKLVVSRLNHLRFNNRSDEDNKSSNAIVMAPTRMRKVTSDSKVNLLEDQNDLGSIDSKEEKDLLQMQCILKSHIAMQEFMRHLVKVRFLIVFLSSPPIYFFASLSYFCQRSTNAKPC